MLRIYLNEPIARTGFAGYSSLGCGTNLTTKS